MENLTHQFMIFCYYQGRGKSYTERTSKIGFGQRESSRGSTIASRLILEIWGEKRSSNPEALAQPKIQFLKSVRYKMARLDQIEKRKEFRMKFSWIKERKLALCLLIGFLFVLALTAFLNFREVRIEVLELGSVADRYLIAQVDFEFPDEDAGRILNQQAVQDIGSIYRLDEKEILNRRRALEEQLIHHPEWRKKLPKATFEELFFGVHQLQNALLQSRFTDERTLSKIKHFDLLKEKFFLLPSEPLSGPLHLDPSFWERIEVEAFEGDPIPAEGADFLIQFFKERGWNLFNDTLSERNLRQAILESLPETYTRIEAGSRLIDSGEKVTLRHVAMMRAMKDALKKAHALWEPLPILGSFLLALLFTSVSIIFFYVKHPDLLRSAQKLTLLATVIFLTLVLAKATEFFVLNQETKFAEFISYPLLVPFASLLLCVLFGTSVAFFISAFLSIILGVTLAFDHDRFLVINLIGALVAIICSRKMHKRKEIFAVCGKVWLATIPVIFAYSLLQNRIWSLNLAINLSSSLAFMIVTAILVIGILPLFESLFDVMTDMGLMEYMDPNNELLRRLSVEAPGTYQHSLVVGNLAETAARTIGANDLFCRVSTLYHDIGKLFNPHYFTENQLGGLNIHHLLTPLESTQVVISHVKEGEGLARKYHLPGSFIDIIREHHGTTLVYYFYCKQVEQMGGDPSKVDESQFRYPGPKPKSKESAILMIADSVEAASRSLTEIHETMIEDLIDRLVKEKADEGQFDECRLTFDELGRVKKSMVQTLLVAHHLRVKYPDKH